MLCKVLTVDEVIAVIQKTNPPELVVTAKGTVPTGGWTNPQLSPYIYLEPPADGIQDFDFLAEKPDGPVAEVITPIDTELTWPDPPDWIKGVRVHASTNSKEQKIGN